jgi:hypothetical protein
MTKTSPPKEIFVVSIKDVQREWGPENGDWVLKNETTHNFGFLHPHEPNKKNDGAREKLRSAVERYDTYEKDITVIDLEITECIE